jgi:mevalonate kinase
MIAAETGMILGRGHAPGKVILFGEHAVVYGRPALAVPVMEIGADAVVEDSKSATGIVIYAQDLGVELALSDAPADHPLAAIVRLTLTCLGIIELPDWRVVVHSTIPIASGLGSGAAVSAAIARALAAANRQDLSPAILSQLIYQVERLYHGTPSGIDNSVIAYEQPVYFLRGQPPQPFAIQRPFTLAIADSGIASPTRATVGDVRRSWEREPGRHEALFDRIAAIAEAARSAMATGNSAALGPLMDENHRLLQEVGVSCRELDALAAAARNAGALGAKLSGAGRGGNLIALVTDETAGPVTAALRSAGAVGLILTGVGEMALPIRNL